MLSDGHAAGCTPHNRHPSSSSSSSSSQATINHTSPTLTSGHARAGKRETGAAITWRQVLLLLLLPLLFAGLLLVVTTTYYYIRIHTVGFAAGEVVPSSEHMSAAHTTDLTHYSHSHYNHHFMHSKEDSVHAAAEALDEMAASDIEDRNDTGADRVTHAHPSAHASHSAHEEGEYEEDEIEYAVLRPSTPLLNESVRNPALHSRTSRNSNTSSVVVSSSSSSLYPRARRYVLDGLQPGRRYMLRLCFLGSPSVWYEVNFLHVHERLLRRKTRLTMKGGGGGDALRELLTRSSSTAHTTRTEPSATQTHSTISTAAEDAASTADEASEDGEYALLDTEVRMFSTHAVYPHRFAHDDLIIQNNNNKEEDEDEEEDEEVNDDDDDVYAVIEIVPHVLALSSAAVLASERFAVVSYNIHLDPLIANWVPKIMIPYLVCFSVLVAGLVQLVLLPCLNRLPQKQD